MSSLQSSLTALIQTLAVITLLGACAAPPPLPAAKAVAVPAQHALELNAVFWADRVLHASNAWNRHQETFTFRQENIPASQTLELLSKELDLGYDMDSCGEMPVSIVGRKMPLQQVIESLEYQAGASVKVDGTQLSMRCESDQLRVYTLDYLSIARQMNDSSSLSSAIAGNPRELPDRRETGNRSELQLNNTQQHNLWQNIELQIEQIIQAEIKPVELTTRERVVDEDKDRAYSNSRVQANRRAS